MTKRLSIIVIAFAMLIALTGVVMADCAPGQTLTSFDVNLGSVSDNIASNTLAQCDGAMFTTYDYSSSASNGRMQAPIIANQTMFRNSYIENTFATGGLTTYSNNFTSNAPGVAGQVSGITTDRNILFESNNGAIMTDEAIISELYGNFPMNGSKEMGIEGGSMVVNHMSGFNSQFVADNLALSSQNNLLTGTVDRASSILGENPDLINLDSTIAVQGHSFGISKATAFSFDQTGLPEITVVGTETNYKDTIALTGNFALQKDFHWNLKSVPTIQQFAPVGSLCPMV
jgi:hypothetical protein